MPTDKPDKPCQRCDGTILWEKCAAEGCQRPVSPDLDQMRKDAAEALRLDKAATPGPISVEPDDDFDEGVACRIEAPIATIAVAVEPCDAEFYRLARTLLPLLARHVIDLAADRGRGVRCRRALAAGPRNTEGADMTTDQKADAEAVARLQRWAERIAVAERRKVVLSPMEGVAAARVLRMLEEREARVAELERALEPFAVLGGPVESSTPAFHDLEDDVVVYENSGCCITAGDCRRARDLLRKDVTS